MNDDSFTVEEIVSHMRTVLGAPAFEDFKNKFDEAAGGYILGMYADVLEGVAERLTVLAQRQNLVPAFRHPEVARDALSLAAQEMKTKAANLREASHELILEGMRRLSRGAAP